MKKFIKEDSEAFDVSFNGVDYAFVVDPNNGVGVRRKDSKKPTIKEINFVTRYAFLEGFANQEDFEYDE